jgi:hypothetical protein
VIKAYLDGSLSEGLVGLVAYVAPERLWARLEREFNGLLDHLRMDHVHMRDLSQRRNSSKDKDPAQAENAAADIVAYPSGLNEWSFRRYSWVVRETDYERAVTGRLQTMTIHAICVDHCTGRLFHPRFRKPNDSERNIEIYFD